MSGRIFVGRVTDAALIGDSPCVVTRPTPEANAGR